MPTRWALLAVVAMATLCSGLALGTSAQAVPQPDDPPGVGDSLSSQVTVNAFPLIGAAQGSQDPTLIPTAGYPAFPSGLTPESVTTAQIQLRDSFGTGTGLAYCIDLETETRVGTNYDSGDWTAATVPNLEYVSYILGAYFPNSLAPVGLSDTDKTAAVQAAIWFFTDNFVLTDASPLRAATQAIVADALANASASQPPLPQLAVTPDSGNIPTSGDLAGPFVIGGNVASVVLDQLGVQTYRDAAGTQPIASGDVVSVGTSVWAQYVSTTVPQGFRVSAVVEHVQGSVYLYNGTNAGVDGAQKLILATATLLPARAGVALAPYEAGQLAVSKLISGDGAGLQSAVTIQLDCTSAIGDFVRTLSLPAEAAAGSHLLTSITDLPVGAMCIVTEPQAGQTDRATLDSVTFSPGTVTVGEGTVDVVVSNVYGLAPAPVPSDPSTLPATGGGPALSAAAVATIALLAGVLLRRKARCSS